MCLVDLLSQYRVAVLIDWTTKSLRRYQIHYISQVVAASAQYFASMDGQEIVYCFFNFHEIREDPRKTRNPFVVAQLESLKALI